MNEELSPLAKLKLELERIDMMINNLSDCAVSDNQKDMVAHLKIKRNAILYSIDNGCVSREEIA